MDVRSKDSTNYGYEAPCFVLEKDHLMICSSSSASCSLSTPIPIDLTIINIPYFSTEQLAGSSPICRFLVATT